MTISNAYGLARVGQKPWLAKLVWQKGHVALSFARPEKPKRIVLFVHGYLDHGPMFYRLAEYFYQRDCLVVLVDLPGHGLSSGDRADIANFMDYGTVLTSLRQSLSMDGLPVDLICTSAGCAAYMQALAIEKGARFNRVVMIAPLLRTVWWKWSKVAMFLGGWAMEDVPRRWDKPCPGCRDLKKDTMQIRKVPLGWIRSFYAWSDRFSNSVLSEDVGLVLQGTKDRVVWWQSNRPLMEMALPNYSWELIEGGGHTLFDDDRYFDRIAARSYEFIDVSGQ